MSEVHDQDLYTTDIRTPEDDGLDDADSHLCNAYRYLKYLPGLELHDVPEGQRECSICQEPYGATENDEEIVQLPQCGHRFGFQCIYEWLSPYNFPNRNTCPMCRKVLFVIDSDDDERSTGGDIFRLTFRDSNEDNRLIFRDNNEDDDERSYGPPPIVNIPPHGYDTAIDQMATVLITELWVTIDLGITIQLLNEAISIYDNHDFGRPISSVWTEWYSSQLFYIFTSFAKLLAPTSLYETPSASDLEQVAQSISVRMGGLYLRFRTQIEAHGQGTPWTEAGPRLTTIMNPARHESIKLGFWRFFEVEVNTDPHNPDNQVPVQRRRWRLFRRGFLRSN